MPSITSPTNSNITQYSGVATAEITEYTYSSTQNRLEITNIGSGTITVYALGEKRTLLPGKTEEFEGDITSFRIKSNGVSVPFSTKADGKVSQLQADNAHIEMYGAYGDGINNDDDAFTKAIADINSGKIKKLTSSKQGQTFLLTKVHYINADDVEIDLGGNEIKWAGTDDLNNNTGDTRRTIGIFNAHGSLGTKYSVLAWQPRVDDIDTIISTVSKVQIADASVFNKGDYVYLKLETGTNTYSDFYPQVSIVCQIVDVDTGTNYVTLDYYDPWDWSNHTLTVAEIYKVNPRKNIKIGGFYLNDTIVPTGTNDPLSSYSSSDGDTFVDGVSYRYCVDVGSKNIKGYNTKFPLVFTQYCYEINHKNLNLRDPAITGGGEGYTIQFSSCMNCHAEKIYSYRSRHSVDFSRSAFGSCKNSKSTGRQTSASFNLHLINEHHITFENCDGSFRIAQGGGYTYNWPDCVSDITLKNCSGIISEGTISGLAQNIQIIGGDLIFKQFSPSTMIVSGGAKIKLWAYNPSGDGGIRPTTKFTNLRSHKYIGCDIELYHPTETHLDTNKLDMMVFENCTIKMTGASDTTYMYFLAKNLQNFAVKNCLLIDASFWLHNDDTGKTVTWEFCGNTEKFTRNINAIAMCKVNAMQGSPIIIFKFKDNNINHTNTNATYALRLYTTGTEYNGATVYMHTGGNTFVSTNLDAVRYWLDQTKVTTLQDAGDNILVNVDTTP